MFSGYCMSTPHYFYQQWEPVLCVVGDTLDYLTIPCFTMNTALTDDVTDYFPLLFFQSSKANSTQEQ